MRQAPVAEHFPGADDVVGWLPSMLPLSAVGGHSGWPGVAFCKEQILLSHLANRLYSPQCFSRGVNITDIDGYVV